MAMRDWILVAIQAAGATVALCSGVMAQPADQPGSYRQLRPELFKALAVCSESAEVLACETASTTLQAMLIVSARPLQRQLRPRCLGSLSQLETHLSVFRWGLESQEQLQRPIEQARADCPAPAPLSAAPAASN